jgi:hypothetical protein
MTTKKKKLIKLVEKSECAKPHELMLMTSAQNAAAMEKLSTYGDFDVVDLIQALQMKNRELKDGSTTPMEHMLYSQAQTLQAIFANMVRRSSLNVGQCMDATETYMRLALKAQSQCRATLETLAIMRNPQPYIRQTNIATGHQQVNNGMASPHENSELPQNKLLEDSHGRTYLDLGAAPTTTRGNSSLEALEQINRAEKPAG